MAALAAISSATPSLQSTLIRSRLEVAKREADLAQEEVSRLRDQVQQAEDTYSNRQDQVRRLSTQASDVGQTDPTYQTQVQRIEPQVSADTQTLLVGMYAATSAKRSAAGNALMDNPFTPAVINTRGEATGRVLSISA